ncbi:MAG: hypothetical protein ACLTTP_00940 [Alistipes ihumii]
MQLFRFVFFLVLWFVVGIYLIPTFLRIRRFLNAETLLVGRWLSVWAWSSWRPMPGSRPLGRFIMGSILAGTTEGEHRRHRSVKDLFGRSSSYRSACSSSRLLVQYLGPILFLTFVVVVGQIF